MQNAQQQIALQLEKLILNLNAVWSWLTSLQQVLKRSIYYQGALSQSKD